MPSRRSGAKRLDVASSCNPRARTASSTSSGGIVKLSGLRLGGGGMVGYLSRMTAPRDPLYAGYRYLAELISLQNNLLRDD